MSNKNIDISDLAGALELQASGLRALSSLLGASDASNQYAEGLSVLLDPFAEQILRISKRLEELSETT